jgi:multiple sugar transport system permease protein
MNGDDLTGSRTQVQQQVSGFVGRRILTIFDHPVLSNALKNPLTWILPALGLLAVFRIYPLLEAIRMSFTDESVIRPDEQYVGIDNYVSMFQSTAFWDMAWITLVFVIVSVVLQLVLGMILALAINYGVKNNLPGSIITRMSVLSAWVIPGIVIGILWKILLIETQYGIVNYPIYELTGQAFPFLSDSTMALGSTILANTWRGTAFSMILLFAGLRQVPQYLYDAAKIDGASTLQRFRYITLPQMKTVIFINLVLITIYTLNTFDMILALTGGGPGRATEVLALFMYFEGFSRYELGGAATVAVFMLAVNILMTVVYIYAFIDEEEF